MESSNLQQENFSSQGMRPLKTNQNVELWKTSPVDEFVKPHTKQRLRVHFILWGRKIVRIRSSGSFLSDFLVCFLGIWEAKPKSPTNTSAGTCATKEEQQQQTYQSDQDNDHEASTPEKKQDTTQQCWKREKWSFPGKSTSTGCSILNVQPYEHLCKYYSYRPIQLHLVICMYMYMPVTQ